MSIVTFPTRFILLCHARTGSSLFGSLLGNHPRISYGGERFKLYRKWSGARAFLRPVIARYPMLRLNWLAQQASRPTFGCKLCPHYVHNIEQTIQQAHQHAWLIIHLTRRNTIKTALSSVVAHQTKRHNSVGEDPHPPPLQLVVEPGALMKAIHRVERYNAQEQAALIDIPHIRICYEDDLVAPTGWEAATGRVFDALGLEHIPAQSSISRPWSRPYEAMISNYADLVAAMRADGYTADLESVP